MLGLMLLGLAPGPLAYVPPMVYLFDIGAAMFYAAIAVSVYNEEPTWPYNSGVKEKRVALGLAGVFLVDILFVGQVTLVLSLLAVGYFITLVILYLAAGVGNGVYDELVRTFRTAQKR